MHWAVTQETAAEVIYNRVDASKPDAGLGHYRGELPTVKEARIAKNYYSEAEINALNVLTSATLEFFESQAEQRRPTTVSQFLNKMRDFIKLDGRPLIPSGHRGAVSHDIARKKAAQEIAAYRERVRLEREHDGEKDVTALLSETRRTAELKRKKHKPKSKK